MVPCIVTLFDKIQQDATVTYCNYTLHVSGVHRTHHQEYM